MDEKIVEAKNLLRENGYVYIKLSKSQIADSKECEEIAASGGQKDCFGCSCSTCVFE